MRHDQEQDNEMDAADWHAQILGGQVDWTAFTSWLDADSSHQAAYDRIALLDAEVAEWASAHGMPLLETPALSRAPVSRRWWLSGAIAASLAALSFGVPKLMTPQHDEYAVYTTTAQQKTVALDGQGSARLDAGSQLALGDAGRVRMDRGAAYFDVRQHGAAPLRVQSGDFTIQDIGTKFTVTRDQGHLFVAVAEGIVDVTWKTNPPVRLTAGEALQGDEQSGRVETTSVSPESVGSWRDGRLVYDNAPLSQVATDVSRYTGVPVEVDSTIANLKLSGVLLIKNGSDLVDQISAILPIEAQRRANSVRLRRRTGR